MIRLINCNSVGARREDVGDLCMQLLTAGDDQVLVYGFTRQCVPEPIAAGSRIFFFEQLRGHACFDRRQDRSLVDSCHGRKCRQVERPADDRRGRQNPDVLARQSLQPLQEGVFDGARDAHLDE